MKNKVGQELKEHDVVIYPVSCGRSSGCFRYAVILQIMPEGTTRLAKFDIDGPRERTNRRLSELVKIDASSLSSELRTIIASIQGF